MGKIFKTGQLVVPSRHLTMNHNVTFVVRDANTMKVQSVHKGHNAATNGLLTGIAHYLTGDGILNQGWHMLSNYVPKYISLGTMGLINQDQDENGLPDGIGVVEGSEESRFEDYMLTTPGFGADGYDFYTNNGRDYLGLGPVFAEREDEGTINCELISDTFPRATISYREIVPEYEAEFAETIDVIFSAMVSVGALSQFREEDKDYLFITEAGLWSKSTWTSSGDNGLLAGYRIAPSDSRNWGMTADSVTDDAAIYYLQSQKDIDNPTEEEVAEVKEEVAEYNRNLLKSSIIRVNSNQVVQVIWKIQLGGLEQLADIDSLYGSDSGELYWWKWDEEDEP